MAILCTDNSELLCTYNSDAYESQSDINVTHYYQSPGFNSFRQLGALFLTMRDRRKFFGLACEGWGDGEVGVVGWGSERDS